MRKKLSELGLQLVEVDKGKVLLSDYDKIAPGDCCVHLAGSEGNFLLHVTEVKSNMILFDDLTHAKIGSNYIKKVIGSYFFIKESIPLIMDRLETEDLYVETIKYSELYPLIEKKVINLYGTKN
jgi:hypothetical protein